MSIWLGSLLVVSGAVIYVIVSTILFTFAAIFTALFAGTQTVPPTNDCHKELKPLLRLSWPLSIILVCCLNQNERPKCSPSRNGAKLGKLGRLCEALRPPSHLARYASHPLMTFFFHYRSFRKHFRQHCFSL